MEGLKKLNNFIIKYSNELIKEYNFKRTDAIDKGMDSASIILISENLKILFTRDRGQTMIFFYPDLSNKNEYISIDMVKRIIIGEEKYNKVTDNDIDRFHEGNLKNRQKSYDLEEVAQGKFLKNNIFKILNLFSKDNISSTLEKINIFINEEKQMKYLWD